MCKWNIMWYIKKIMNQKNVFTHLINAKKNAAHNIKSISNRFIDLDNELNNEYKLFDKYILRTDINLKSI